MFKYLIYKDFPASCNFFSIEYDPLMRKILVTLMVVALCACSSEKPRQFSVIHFNDTYQIDPVKKGKVGGAARVAHVLKQQEKSDPLILFGGDALAGAYLSVTSKGKHMVDIFNALGLDYAVFGNHEFDFGLEVLSERVKDSKFKWLSANIVDKRTQKPAAGAFATDIIERGGVKVGLVGLASDWLSSTMPGDNVQYKDFIDVAQKAVKDLQAQGAEFVIALTHMDLKFDRHLAREVDGIHLILGGHEHDPIREEVNDTLILKSGSDWEHLISLNIHVKKNGKFLVQDKWIAINEDVPDEPEMLALVKKTLDFYQNSTKLADEKLLGHSKVAIDLTRSHVRSKESGYGNWVADVIREHAQADVALMNGGGLRSNQVLQPGHIKAGLLKAIHPFGNKVVSLKIKGEILKQAIEHGLSAYPGSSGGYPHLSGVKIKFDPSRKKGDRVISFEIKGQPLQKDKEYILATNSYLAAGGNGYTMFKGAPMVIDDKSGLLIAQVVGQAVAKAQTIHPKVDGRVLAVK